MFIGKTLTPLLGGGGTTIVFTLFTDLPESLKGTREKLTFLVSTQLVKSPIPVIKVYNDFHTPCRVQAPYLIAKDIACWYSAGRVT